MKLFIYSLTDRCFNIQKHFDYRAMANIMPGEKKMGSDCEFYVCRKYPNYLSI